MEVGRRVAAGVNAALRPPGPPRNYGRSPAENHVLDLMSDQCNQGRNE